MNSRVSSDTSLHLQACAVAVDELQRVLSALLDEPARAADHIAVLHALEDRVHRAFADYQRVVLED